MKVEPFIVLLCYTIVSCQIHRKPSPGSDKCGQNHVCPKYKIVEKHQAYEIRTYDTTYIITTANSHDFLENFDAYSKIEGYVQENGYDKYLPILVCQSLNETRHQLVYTTLYLGPKLSNQVKPQQENIKIRKLKHKLYYIKDYEFSGETNVRDKIQELKQELDKDKIEYDAICVAYYSHGAFGYSEIWFFIE